MRVQWAGWSTGLGLGSQLVLSLGVVRLDVVHATKAYGDKIGTKVQYT